MQSISRAERRRSSRELAKRPQWGTLEEFTWSRIQSWLQEVLEEEVSDLLGRGKSERRAAVDAPEAFSDLSKQATPVTAKSLLDSESVGAKGSIRH
jgi:hypothetical protein